MSINMTQLVNPGDYDEQLYDLTHNVLDRTIELASLVDQVDDEGPQESEDGEILETLRSQAAFTPAERNELSLTQHLLSVLINTCIARRAGLYHNNPHDDYPTPDPNTPEHPA